MARTQYAYCRIQRVPYCCGAIEAGNFYVGYIKPRDVYSLVMGTGKTKKEAAEKLLTELLSRRNTSVQFWFKRHAKTSWSNRLENMTEKKYSKKFIASELMDVLIDRGGVEMARYVNPNTHNEIRGIIYTKNTHKVKPDNE